jgi:hypothetical protein
VVQDGDILLVSLFLVINLEWLWSKRAEKSREHIPMLCFNDYVARFLALTRRLLPLDIHNTCLHILTCWTD